MRIATAYSYDSAIATLQRRQQDMVDVQGQMTTGKRVSKPSDDPVAAARAERAAALISRAEADQRTADTSRNVMTLTESALGQAVDLLQTARETMVQAGNGTYTPAERDALATKLQQIREQLFATANRSDGAGGYLFGGQGSSAPPFVDTVGGVDYIGQGGNNQANAGEPVPLTTDGRAVWLQASSGNGVFETAATVQNGSAWIDAGSVTNPSAITGHDYSIQFSVSGSPAVTTYSVLDNTAGTTLVSGAPYTSGKSIALDGMSLTIQGEPANGDEFSVAPSDKSLSVFDALDAAIATLSDASAPDGQVKQAINQGLRDIDSVTNNVASARSAVGETLNRLDGVTDRLDAQKLAAKTEKSNAEDLDMVQAISDFQNQQTGYNAALQAYSLVQRMSLMNYIS
ncbi:MAG: flagellar hook-associated protein FlgL [Burkholderiales bacterium]|nr:flagellar hook-associated protein FlgL [Burkholderiales bacterium]MCH2240892.1 flagellar hook-associated protein FlgL [Aquabacterium sp.]